MSENKSISSSGKKYMLIALPLRDIYVLRRYLTSKVSLVKMILSKFRHIYTKNDGDISRISVRHASLITNAYHCN